MTIDRFLDYLEREKKYTRNTIKAYQKDLCVFWAFARSVYGLTDERDINYPIIRNWIVELVEEGLCNRSINRKITSLNSYFKFLMKTDVLLANPLIGHKALKTGKRIQIPFSEKEIDLVLTGLETDGSFKGIRDRAIIELFYATGIRQAELINIKIKEVDLEAKTLKVMGKGNKERIIPMIDSVCHTLINYIDVRRKLDKIIDDAYLFLTKKGTKMYESLVYRTIKSYFSSSSKKVKKSPHVLRHSFATHLLNQGASLNAVKELLGHTSLAATQVYTYSSIAELKKVHALGHPRNKK